MEIFDIIEVAGLGFVVLIAAFIVFWVWVIVSVVHAIVRISYATEEKAEAYTRRARAYERFVNLQCVKYEESGEKVEGYGYQRDNGSY